MARSEKKRFSCIGHRGWPEKFPENSLSGILATLDVGADGVEFDIQLTKDGVPVVFHDISLQRTCSVDGDICDHTFDELKNISAHEFSRFEDNFFATPIITLAELCVHLRDYNADFYIEIKREPLERLGRKKVLESVLESSSDISDKRIIISFDYDVIDMAKTEYHERVGWVIKTYEESSRKRAQLLNPEFLICNYKKFPPYQSIWEGNWKWFVYDVVDTDTITHLLDLGVTAIESWDVPVLLTYE